MWWWFTVEAPLVVWRIGLAGLGGASRACTRSVSGASKVQVGPQQHDKTKREVRRESSKLRKDFVDTPPVRTPASTQHPPLLVVGPVGTHSEPRRVLGSDAVPLAEPLSRIGGWHPCFRHRCQPAITATSRAVRATQLEARGSGFLTGALLLWDADDYMMRRWAAMRLLGQLSCAVVEETSGEAVCVDTHS